MNHRRRRRPSPQAERLPFGRTNPSSAARCVAADRYSPLKLEQPSGQHVPPIWADGRRLHANSASTCVYASNRDSNRKIARSFTCSHGGPGRLKQERHLCLLPVAASRARWALWRGFAASGRRSHCRIVVCGGLDGFKRSNGMAGPPNRASTFERDGGPAESLPGLSARYRRPCHYVLCQASFPSTIHLQAGDRRFPPMSKTFSTEALRAFTNPVPASGNG